MRLDVGCGCSPTGDVNCDLYPDETSQRKNCGAINIKNTRNFVRCDALHLPFKSKSFREVYSFQVIEHVHDPIRFLKECIRVAQRKVEVWTCHRYWRVSLIHGQPKEHVTFFNTKWFAAVLKQFSYQITPNFRPMPHFLLPLTWWTSTLCVEVWL